ncbi:MAG TPA: cupredoxin domain-containing protein, partial [Actinomycetota bacterium]|nr:cupredoxin domain-containing protein [Actinomycetota bacterium]
GGASAPATPSPLASSPATCSPRGRVLRLVARGIAFDATCLAAPAGRPSVIEFRNEDPGIRHNVAISTEPTGGRELFRGRIVEGPGTTTYRLPSLEPGTYFFRCDIHPPQMHGTFVVA